MMAGRNLCWAAGAAIFAICILQVSGNERVCNCSVTKDAGLKYMIIDAQELNDKCRFSWNNGSGFVISSHKNTSGKGWNSSISSLNTSQCFGYVVFKGHCPIGRFWMDFIAHCTTNCSTEALPHQSTDEPTRSWIAIVSILLAVAVTSAIMLYIYKLKKKKGWRPKAVYTFLRKNDDKPKPLDVEAGNE